MQERSRSEIGVPRRHHVTGLCAGFSAMVPAWASAPFCPVGLHPPGGMPMGEARVVVGCGIWGGKGLAIASFAAELPAGKDRVSTLPKQAKGGTDGD